MYLPIFEFIESQRVILLKDYYFKENEYIPTGFESDLGSVPVLFHWFLKPTDIKYSAIVHDFNWLMADFGKYSYYESNIDFYKNCIELDKIPRYKAIICFISVEIVRIYKKIMNKFHQLQ